MSCISSCTNYYDKIDNIYNHNLSRYKKSVYILEDYEDFEELAIELTASNLFYNVTVDELKRLSNEMKKEVSGLNQELNIKDADLMISNNRVDSLQDK